MKINPVTQGSGVPAGSVGSDRMPNDRLAAAKAVFEGKEPTQAPDPTVDPQVARAQSVRKMRMKTNVTPEANMPSPEQLTEAVAPEAAAQIDNPDVNEQAQETSDTKPLSPQFAALAKQRRALQTERAAFEAERKAFEEQKTGITQNSNFLEQLKSNPLQTLLEAGVTYDQLTEQILADQSGVNPQIAELKAEIKALKEGVDKSFSERESQAEAQVIAEMTREAQSLVAQGDDYEQVRSEGAIPDSIELIKTVYKEGWPEKNLPAGHVMDVSDALNIIENYLLEQNLRRAQYKKVQAKLQPQPQQTAPGQKQMRTLTARDGVSMPLTAKQRAMAAFNGTLKR